MLTSNEAVAGDGFGESKAATPTRKRNLPAKHGVIAQVFGHFTRGEFWIELLEVMVKAAVTASVVAIGDALIRFGKKRGGAENVELFSHAGLSSVPPPTQAYASRGYTPSAEYRSGPTYPPVSSAQNQGFPGFPGR